MQIYRVCSQLRNKIGRPTLHRMRFEYRMRCRGRAIRVALLGDSAAEERRILRLAYNDLGFRTLFCQDPCNTLERAAGAITGDPVIKRLPAKIGNDLARRRARMHIRISLILELTREEPTVSFGELSRFYYHAHATECSRRKHNLGAEKAHKLAPLDAERRRHRDDQRIAFLRAHHSEANSGIAARGLDNCLARFQLSGALGSLNNAKGETVLHGTERIECFNLHIDVHVWWREFVDLDDRCIADSFKNVLKSCHRRPLGACIERDGTYISSATKTPDRSPSNLTKIKAVERALGEFMASESSALRGQIATA